MHDPDTARWDHMRRLSARAALLARAEKNQPDAQTSRSMFGLAEAQEIAALSPPEDDHGADMIMVRVFAAFVAVALAAVVFDVFFWGV